MLITVRCPQCHDEYHLQPDMRGKLTRCKNQVCRSVFEVREVEKPGPEPKSATGSADGGRPAPFEPTPARQQGGNVGDIIPILPAESAYQEPLPEPGAPRVPSSIAGPQDAGSWHQPPPVRRGAEPVVPPVVPPRRETPTPPARKTESLPRKTVTPDTTKVAKRTETLKPAPAPRPPDPVATAGPIEMPAGVWEPPPVRRGNDPVEANAAAPGAESGDKLAPLESVPITHRSTRALKWVIAGSLSATVVVLLVLVFVVLPKSEQKQAEHAQQLFAARSYGQAREAFAQLQKEFPNSESSANYEFLERLSLALNQAEPPITDVSAAFESLRGICQEAANDSQVRERKDPVVRGLVHIAEGAAGKASSESDTKMLTVGRDATRLADRFEPAAEQKKKIADLRKQMDAAEEQIAHAEQLKLAKEDLAALVGDLDGFERKLGEQVRLLPELKQDADVLKMRRDAIQKFQDRVTWTAKPAKLPKDISEEREPSLVVAPAVSAVRTSVDDNSIIFALARGVLYAFQHMRPVWQVRVGIDTTALPVRLPATEYSAERALVLSADTMSLTARDVRTGKMEWRYQLTAPCLGRPVVVKHEGRAPRAYVPTTDGKVHVLETVEGQLIGWYDLGGKPLTVGGVHQRLHIPKNGGKTEERDYLYVPADERHVFVLDIGEAAHSKPCVDILEVGHPSGSLRSEPILLSRDDQRQIDGTPPDKWPDLLMLYQADGLNKMKVRLLRVAVPGQSKAAEGAALDEPSVGGWAWFPPYHDSEKLVQVTDAGRLGVVGIKQLKNEDSDLFVEFAQPLFKGSGQPARAQIVHVAEDDFWILAEGKLQLWHFDRFGKKVARVWQTPLALGSPLHASQVNTVQKTAYVVSQDPQKPTCWISAVDISIESTSNTLRQQVQLGLLCQGDPLLLGDDVLALDEGGNLFRFNPAKAERNREWQVGGEIVVPAEEVAGRRQFLLRSRDGKSLFAVAKVSDKTLLVRQYDPAQANPPHTYEFATDLAGTPGVGDDCLVLAGTDGILYYIPLPLKGGQPKRGPEWRARLADPQAAGHIVHLGGMDFLATNGRKGLTHRQWDGGIKFPIIAPKVKGAGSGTEQDVVGASIVAPPLVLPRANANDPLQVIVADAHGKVTLLREVTKGNDTRWHSGEGDQWDLGGHLTAGPFLRGNLVGCVVDQDRLVMIDPHGNGKPWQYSKKGEGIVGQPQIVDGMLLVAHRTGRFVGVDLATGKPFKEDGHELKAKTAPAATPVPFGEGRAFAPLTDGTVMLLSLKHLRPQVEAAAK